MLSWQNVLYHTGVEWVGLARIIVTIIITVP
jgi:hypothetical protein